MAEVRTLLGFDFGEVRIGVAVGNTLTESAQPLTVLASVPTR
ncbi:MAG: Holliday junction resolvase RuvX, partial [Burkholderiaceae bacterium]|nr:Holliday junction resolvase RuvX [Burkholderiaceae bacterium]